MIHCFFVSTEGSVRYLFFMSAAVRIILLQTNKPKTHFFSGGGIFWYVAKCEVTPPWLRKLQHFVLAARFPQNLIFYAGLVNCAVEVFDLLGFLLPSNRSRIRECWCLENRRRICLGLQSVDKALGKEIVSGFLAGLSRKLLKNSGSSLAWLDGLAQSHRFSSLF